MTPRVRLSNKGEIVLTLSLYDARMTGDALGETVSRHGLDKHGGTARVLRAIDRGIARCQTRTLAQAAYDAARDAGGDKETA